jgi:hypothetical protein
MLAVACLIISCEKNPTGTHSHKYGTDWISDETHHWKECNCGEQSNKAEHIFDEEGICSVCLYESNQESENYEIGDIGPAGGIIFYDKGDLTDGWRYLEAALATSEFTAPWGAYGNEVVGTQKEIGTGKNNTQLIITKLIEIEETGKAAQLCVELTIGEYSDWFLPSIDELEEMYLNLHTQDLGGFENPYYWSSSTYEDSNNHSWLYYFGNGGMVSGFRYNSFRVRCVRRF